MKYGLYGIYEMNCGLNVGKQEKQIKKLTPALPTAVGRARRFPSEQPSFADSWALPTASAIALPTA
jgi:hypothetical protein